VIHLGAIVGDPACALDEELTIEINLMATRMIAEVAKGSGVSRFIFASTCSVYGASDQVLDERSALNPVSLYARSKIASEKVLRKLADDHFAPVILRFGDDLWLVGTHAFRFSCQSADRQGDRGAGHHCFRWRPVASICTRRRCGAGGLQGAG